MKNIFKTTAAIAFAFSVNAFAADIAENFAFKGNIQTQAVANNNDDGLESFWFRANLGGMYKSENFDAQIMIRMFGPHCGNKINGKEYDKFVKPSEPSRAPEDAQPQPARGGFLDNFLNSLTPEKITAYSLAVKTLKELFAPPPPPPPTDWAAILQILNATNKDAKPALSDTIVLSAMETMKEKQKQPSFLEQYREIKELERELKDGTSSEGDDDEDDDEENGETMNALLKMAMAYLPQLLQKNNNNFQATGAEAAENAYIKNLVSSDPQLALTFFEKAKQKYGLENAQKLALGFGYNLQDAPQEKGAEGAENG